MTRDIVVATVAMGVIAAALYGTAAWRSPAVVASGGLGGARNFVTILPLLALSFAIAGLVQAWVPREVISRWLGAQSGLRGIGIGCLMGAVTPGGPYISFPIVAAIYKAGAGIGTVVAFVTAWSLWAVARLPLELALIGPEVTLKRIAATAVFPPLAGLLARVLFE
ncbi:MAG: permease [Armatimonadota bacterium]|nr:MAG: permease [Armatimonadota bacterium]